MLRTIIIDDEISVRKSLEKLIALYCPNIKLISEADGVVSGINAINKFHPDLVLLDIKMDDGTGFDLLQNLNTIDFKVIFITAYDQYAIKAFRFSALDYLLKPVDHEELVAAVNKAQKIIMQELHQQLNTLKENMRVDERSMQKIILKTFDSIHFITLNDIIYCESQDNYTNFHLVGERKILVSNTLKSYDEILSESGFFRVHKSYLINFSHISRFDKAEGGCVILDDNLKIPVASRKKDQLLDMLNKIVEK